MKRVSLAITNFEPWAKGCRQSVKAGKLKQTNKYRKKKEKKKDCLLEFPTGMQPCWHVDFNPVRTVLNYWTTELWDSKLTLFVLSHKVYDILIQYP